MGLMLVKKKKKKALMANYGFSFGCFFGTKCSSNVDLLSYSWVTSFSTLRRMHSKSCYTPGTVSSPRGVVYSHREPMSILWLLCLSMRCSPCPFTYARWCLCSIATGDVSSGSWQHKAAPTYA